MTAISSRTMLVALALAALPLFWFPFAEYATVSSWGSDAFLWLGTFLILPALAAVVVFVAAPIALCFRKTRRVALAYWVCATAYFLAMIVGVRIGGQLRMQGFAALTHRSETLVAAVKAYEAKYGRPPNSLEALVPDFIDRKSVV